MEQLDYTFNIFNEYAKQGIEQTLKALNKNNKTPIVVCIGSDLILGDSLGPLVGTFLKKDCANSYIYGTLNAPITAKEIEYAKTYIKIMHPNSIIIAVDAAVGKEEDVGLIRVINKGLKPGLGVNKNLGEIGDISVIGIVASKSKENYNLFNMTRLNLVYKMSEIISESINDYIVSTQNSYNNKATV